jgi:hypothetical protein
MEVRKYCNHSKKVVNIALERGWFPGARYTNLRDVRGIDLQGIGFIDIDWKNYDFGKHIEIVQEKRPHLTIARDVECIFQLDGILKEAEKLQEFCDNVAIVPKDRLLHGRIGELIPKKFFLGYSVPTKYGGTPLHFSNFLRPTHLLGGRPDVQRKIADKVPVYSVDCNRFTLDARFGDYFDGEIFRPHPIGGYEQCLIDSVKNINLLWLDYRLHETVLEHLGC